MRVLCMMHFLNPRTHVIPFFLSSKILPIQLLFFENVSQVQCIMYQIVMHLKQSLKDFLSVALYICIIKGLLLVAIINLNFHVSINS